MIVLVDECCCLLRMMMTMMMERWSGLERIYYSVQSAHGHNDNGCQQQHHDAL